MLRRRMASALSLSVVGAFCLTTVLGAAAEAPVAEAARTGDREAVRALLKQGVDVNAAQGDGMTALHWAARLGDVELAQMLLYAGANVKAMTRLGSYTPLLMAAQIGNAPMLQALIKAGGDPKAATNNGTTPLMLAAASGKADAVRVLLDSGADPNAKESARGETALMFAANFNRVDAMKALIEKGADIKVATKVTDLEGLTSPEEEFFRQQQQQQGGGQGAPAAGRGPGAGAQVAHPHRRRPVRVDRVVDALRVVLVDRERLPRVRVVADAAVRALRRIVVLTSPELPVSTVSTNSSAHRVD